MKRIEFDIKPLALRNIFKKNRNISIGKALDIYIHSKEFKVKNLNTVQRDFFERENKEFILYKGVKELLLT